MNVDETIRTEDYLQGLAQAFDDAGLYYGHGTDNAWDEACWLLETVMQRHGVRQLSPDMRLDPGSIELREIDTLSQTRIATRKPLAYLLSEAWFCGRSYYVDERVLVPRSPLAELIDNRFEALIPHEPARILDLCTGSGCIGIACALEFPQAEVVLADLSADALAVAAINIERHDVKDRVGVVESDLFEKVEGTFDLILCNPPYVGESEYGELPDEYRHEPAFGLLSEEEGLAIPRRILAAAARYLNEGGHLILETGATWPLLDAAFQQLPFLWLEFEQGGEGVCMLSRKDLLTHLS